MRDLPLFDDPAPMSFPKAKFSGQTYDEKLDKRRLVGQASQVFEIMKKGDWLTLSEIQSLMSGNASEAGISARLRDFRKRAFGAHVVLRRRRGASRSGLFEYKLIISE